MAGCVISAVYAKLYMQIILLTVQFTRHSFIISYDILVSGDIVSLVVFASEYPLSNKGISVLYSIQFRVWHTNILLYTMHFLATTQTPCVMNKMVRFGEMWKHGWNKAKTQP